MNGQTFFRNPRKWGKSHHFLFNVISILCTTHKQHFLHNTQAKLFLHNSETALHNTHTVLSAQCTNGSSCSMNVVLLYSTYTDNSRHDIAAALLVLSMLLMPVIAHTQVSSRWMVLKVSAVFFCILYWGERCTKRKCSVISLDRTRTGPLSIRPTLELCQRQHWISERECGTHTDIP